MAAEKRTALLIVGGGISGITSAVEAAEAGYDVVLVEKGAYLGGRVAQMSKYFPKLCPPTCGLEINFRRIRANPRITYYTLAEVEEVAGQAGKFTVTLRLNPRYVNDRCVGCNACTEVCPVEVPNDFNYGLDRRKAAYLPHAQAFPFQYVLDESACRKTECARCVEACRYGAIDLAMRPERLKVEAASIILATGWKPYDAAGIGNLGFGTSPDIITNVVMERLAAPNGPTRGRLLRPSDKREARSVAFVQCAGSRDENHLAFCSSVCCMASLKQATYVTEQYADAKVYVFYIDIRASGTAYERFLTRVREDGRISLIKGKVGRVTEDPVSRDVIVEAEDALRGRKVQVRVDLCVLATGMVPRTQEVAPASGLQVNGNGFLARGNGRPGVHVVGCVSNPADVATSVREATGAALRGIQAVARAG